MSRGQRLAMHGRDHRPGGADPIPGFGECNIHFGTNDSVAQGCPNELLITMNAYPGTFYVAGGDIQLLNRYPNGTGITIRVEDTALNRYVLIQNLDDVGPGIVHVRAMGGGIASDLGTVGAIVIETAADGGGGEFWVKDMIALKSFGSRTGISLYANEFGTTGNQINLAANGVISLHAAGSDEVGDQGVNVLGDHHAHFVGGATGGGFSGIFCGSLLDTNGYPGSTKNCVITFPDDRPGGNNKFIIRGSNHVEGSPNFLEIWADGTYHIQTNATWLADL